jgi:hypothetical protein
MIIVILIYPSPIGKQKKCFIPKNQKKIGCTKRKQIYQIHFFSSKFNTPLNHSLVNLSLITMYPVFKTSI